MHESGVSRGFGRMQYRRREEALDAVKSLNGYEIFGRPISVELNDSARKAKSMGKRLTSTRLVFANVLFEIEAGFLKELFGKYGKVVFFDLQRTKNGRSMGRGEVEFSTCAEAENAYAKLESFSIGGRTLLLYKKNGQGRGQSGLPSASAIKKPKKLVFKNVHCDTPPEFLCGLFMKYGKIGRFQLRNSSSGTWLGGGCVEFDIEQEAKAAKDHLNGAEVDGKVIVVEYDAHDPAMDSEMRVGFSNVPVTTPPAFVREIFEEFGPLSDFSPWTTSSGKFKGLGSVTYEELEDARTAVESLNGAEVDDQRMMVTPRIPVEFCTNPDLQKSMKCVGEPADDMDAGDDFSPGKVAPCKRKSPSGMSWGDDDLERSSADRIGTKDTIDFPPLETRGSDNAGVVVSAEIHQKGGDPPGQSDDRASPKKNSPSQGREPEEPEIRAAPRRKTRPSSAPCAVKKDLVDDRSSSSEPGGSSVPRRTKTARMEDSIQWKDL